MLLGGGRRLELGLVGALEQGKRRQPSLSAVARDLGLGISTVHKSLERPVGIGAVVVHPSRGVRVLDPWRLLVLWAGRRNLEADVTARSTTSLTVAAAERQVVVDGGRVLGGFGGLVRHLGDNPIAAYDTVIYYGEPLGEPLAEPLAVPPSADAPMTTTLVCLEPDPQLFRYGPVAPLAQCWVDLFNTPGWQAARFVEETPRELIGAAA